MSRYALWLAPLLAVPALTRLSTRGRARPALVTLGALSLLSTFQDYLPNRAERYLEPTPLAAWLWTRHPELDRPLPGYVGNVDAKDGNRAILGRLRVRSGT